jgi:ATP-dependent exoDNAse (exonuclease V) beta subunit
MSDAVGEIDYNEKERLVYGADYSKKDTPDVELLCLDYSEFNSADATSLEAEQIAEYIKKLLSSRIKIKTKQGERRLESSDICILLRNLKSKAAIYSEALKDVGIPSNTVLDGDVSQSKEIQFLVSLIKVVSNPSMWLYWRNITSVSQAHSKSVVNGGFFHPTMSIRVDIIF